MPFEEQDTQAWHALPASWQTTALQSDGSVLLESSLPGVAEQHHSYLFTVASQILTANQPDNIPAVFQQIEAALAEGKWVAGWIAYEAGAHFQGLPAPRGPAPVAIFGIYEQPEIFDHLADTGKEEAKEQPEPLAMAPMLRIDRASYTHAINRIQEWIAAGDTYQVNFTTSANTPYTGSAASLYEALRAQQPCSYGGIINLQPHRTVLSFSPELFFRASPDGTLTTKPMKGTAARGSDSDERLAENLRNDEKNRAEHVMIVDLLRNDLGQICAPGSVKVDRLFNVETYTTLLQMTSTITGRLPHALPWYDVFRALFPSGSITGAPKHHTMELISQVEHRPRGIYTGAIGYFAPDRSACFNVAIRTAVLENNSIEVGVGGGIVADSTADEEYKEILLKTSFLQRAAEPLALIETMRWQREPRSPAPPQRCQPAESEAKLRDLLFSTAGTEALVASIPLLARHMARLQESAEALGFLFHPQGILAAIEQATTTWDDQPKRMRLLLQRDGTCMLQHAALPAWRPSMKVLFSAQSLQSDAPYLRHKTTFRPNYDPAFQAAAYAGYDETIFSNEHGEITEGCITSLLVGIGGSWFTPPLPSGCLPGVYRAALLDAGLVSERIITLDLLRVADHLCLCNAVRGTGSVKSLHLPGGEGITYKVASSTPQLPAW